MVVLPWIENRRPGREFFLAGFYYITFTGEEIDGYILELQAVDQFYFSHDGEEVLVMPGIDIFTHVTIVGSFPRRSIRR